MNTIDTTTATIATVNFSKLKAQFELEINEYYKNNENSYIHKLEKMRMLLNVCDVNECALIFEKICNTMGVTHESELHNAMCFYDDYLKRPAGSHEYLDNSPNGRRKYLERSVYRVGWRNVYNWLSSSLVKYEKFSEKVEEDMFFVKTRYSDIRKNIQELMCSFEERRKKNQELKIKFENQMKENEKKYKKNQEKREKREKREKQKQKLARERFKELMEIERELYGDHEEQNITFDELQTKLSQLKF